MAKVLKYVKNSFNEEEYNDFIEGFNTYLYENNIYFEKEDRHGHEENHEYPKKEKEIGEEQFRDYGMIIGSDELDSYALEFFRNYIYHKYVTPYLIDEFIIKNNFYENNDPLPPLIPIEVDPFEGGNEFNTKYNIDDLMSEIEKYNHSYIIPLMKKLDQLEKFGK